MIIPELKLGDAVQLDWDDSKSALGWVYRTRKLRTPGRVRSLGYVVEVNPGCITITTSLDREVGSSIDDLSIPVGCITRIEQLPETWNVEGPEAI